MKTFGRVANVSPALATTLSLKYPELIKLWQERHERYLNRAKDRIQKNKQKYKRQQDLRIALPQRIFEPGDLVKIANTKENKLSPEWKGPATVVNILPSNNYEILFHNKRIIVYANRLKKQY